MTVLLSDILSESSHLKAVNTTIIIETNGIDDTIFSIILQIRKKHNRADADNIQKQIIKSVDFENITKEFLDDIIHTLITDGRIIDNVVTPIHTISTKKTLRQNQNNYT